MSQFDFVEDPNQDWLLIRDILNAFEYDPHTGIIRNRVNRGKAIAGDITGVPAISGNVSYILMRFGMRTFRAHRIAWVLMRGEWPKGDIDHINRNGLDNRWINLRDVTRSVNIRNQRIHRDNRSGVMGVFWHEKRNKWIISLGRKYLGITANFDEACRIRRAAEIAAGDYITSLNPRVPREDLVAIPYLEMVFWLVDRGGSATDESRDHDST